MVVDIPFLVGIGYMFGQHFETNGFSDNPRCQITLGVENIAVFISIFIDNSLVLVEEFANGKVDIRRFWALKIPLGPLSDIALSNGIFIGL